MSSAFGGEGRNHLLRGEGGFWLGCARGLENRETVSSNHKFPLTSMSIGDFFGHEYAHTHTGGPTEYGDMAALAYDRAQRGRWRPRRVTKPAGCVEEIITRSFLRRTEGKKRRGVERI
jgi:hypothetical protein